MNSKLSLIAIASLSAMLAACGGGGGGGDDEESPSTSLPSNSTPIQMTAVPGSYTTPGLATAFDFLNRERLRCGLGALKQNASLDQAAKNHALYLTTYPGSDPHFENSNGTGFTGYSPLDRAVAAGYKTEWNEVMEAGVLPWIELHGEPHESMEDYPMHAVKTDLTGPFHGLTLLSPGIDIGMAFEGTNKTFGNIQTIQMNFIANIGRGQFFNGQQPGTGEVRTFPCQGSEGILPAVFSEWLYTGPLIPGRVLNTDPASSPIYVFGEYGTTLTISGATITRVSTGEVLPIAKTSTKLTDNIHGELHRDTWSGFVLADKPFVPGQAYRVKIEGKNDNTPFIKEFTFTPGQFSYYDRGVVANLGLETR